MQLISVKKNQEVLIYVDLPTDKFLVHMVRHDIIFSYSCEFLFALLLDLSLNSSRPFSSFGGLDCNCVNLEVTEET